VYIHIDGDAIRDSYVHGRPGRSPNAAGRR
jgi:hypothetical protein